MTIATKKWEAPGPGLWERDEAHQSTPFSGYMVGLVQAHFIAGMREAGRRYGLLIDGFDIRFLEGWMFMRPRIVGAPEKPGGLPPRWLFRLMFSLHPELRRRTSAAKKATAGSLWRQDAHWWIAEGREPMVARLRGLQATNVATLSDADLIAHLIDVEAALAEGWRIHFRDALAHWIGVGDWLARVVEWTGVAPDEALSALAGSSPASVDTLAFLDRIATASRRSDAALSILRADGDASERLAALRSSASEVQSALDAYLDEHGWRIYTGFDIADKATVELPQNILDSIAARLEPPDDRGTTDTYASELRAKVPQAQLVRYDELFDTARLLYGVRDDDAGPCFHWTIGLMRRALLESGDRLSEKGLIQKSDHIFDAKPSEVRELLSGAEGQVSAEKLAERANSRAVGAGELPPARIGEDEGPPPPDDWMPAEVARVNGALMLAMSVEIPAPAELSNGTVVNGLAASQGQYEGRACVVQGPDDFGRLCKGDILVAPFTTTAYNVVLPLLGGVATDKGGVLSHAAIVAREYSIPAVVNTGNATSLIADGAWLRIDGTSGIVEVVDEPAGVV
jgi:phosphohistidine swiveling domain-containing protein